MANVLLFGTGSIGAIYAYILTQASCKVTTLCRSNFEAVTQNGLSIDSEKFGNVTCRPHRIINSASACNEGYDYIVICTKAFPGRISLAEDLKISIVKNTCLVLIQNGIGIEDELHETFPELEMVSGVVYLPTNQHAPGKIKMGAEDLLELGHFPAKPPSAALERFAALLRQGNGRVILYDDIQARRWRKMIINSSWNPIGALTLNTDAGFVDSSPEAIVVVKRVMMEIVDIAKSLGYQLSERDVEIQLDRAVQRSKAKKGIKMSMLADVEMNRSLEVEAILGNPMRIGKRRNIDTPNLNLLYVLANARDQKIRSRMTHHR